MCTMYQECLVREGLANLENEQSLTKLKPSKLCTSNKRDILQGVCPAVLSSS